MFSSWFAIKNPLGQIAIASFLQSCQVKKPLHVISVNWLSSIFANCVWLAHALKKILSKSELNSLIILNSKVNVDFVAYKLSHQ